MNDQVHTPKMPDLFSMVPLGLFRPLGDQYARLYWAMLARFYAHKFEGNPNELPRQLAVDFAEEILAESPEWAARSDEIASSVSDIEDGDGGDTRDPQTVLRSTVRRLVVRLEKSGWYYFEYYRESGEVLNFHPYAARLLAQMMSVARDEQPVLRGYAHAVASMIREEEYVRSPGVTIGKVRQQTLEFARELRILHGNIRDSINRLFADGVTAAGVLQEALDRYEDRVRRNYHFLKTRDNVFGWRTYLLERLAEIEKPNIHLEEAIRWYSEDNGVSRERARLLVNEDLQLIRSHIEAIPQIMREIDERNQRFSGVAARRVAYLLRHDARMEGQLQSLVDALGTGRIPGLALNVYRAEFLGPDFLYVPRRRRAPVDNALLRTRPKVDEAAADREFAGQVFTPHRRSAIVRFVLDTMAGRPRLPVSELPLTSDDDYVRLLHVVAFGDGASGTPYRFVPIHCEQRECVDLGCEICRFRRGPYSIPNGHLVRRMEVRR